jgi:hypothetical protein
MLANSAGPDQRPDHEQIIHDDYPEINDHKLIDFLCERLISLLGFVYSREASLAQFLRKYAGV